MRDDKRKKGRRRKISRRPVCRLTSSRRKYYCHTPGGKKEKKRNGEPRTLLLHAEETRGIEKKKPGKREERRERHMALCKRHRVINRAGRYVPLAESEPFPDPPFPTFSSASFLFSPPCYLALNPFARRPIWPPSALSSARE